MSQDNINNNNKKAKIHPETLDNLFILQPPLVSKVQIPGMTFTVVNKIKK